MDDVTIGSRVRYLSSSDRYTSLKKGDMGVVTENRIDPYGDAVITIWWDNGSTLSLIPALGDRFEVVEVMG